MLLQAFHSYLLEPEWLHFIAFCASIATLVFDRGLIDFSLLPNIHFMHFSSLHDVNFVFSHFTVKMCLKLSPCMIYTFSPETVVLSCCGLFLCCYHHFFLFLTSCHVPLLIMRVLNLCCTALFYTCPTAAYFLHKFILHHFLVSPYHWQFLHIWLSIKSVHLCILSFTRYIQAIRNPASLNVIRKGLLHGFFFLLMLLAGCRLGSTFPSCILRTLLYFTYQIHRRRLGFSTLYLAGFRPVVCQLIRL